MSCSENKTGVGEGELNNTGKYCTLPPSQRLIIHIRMPKAGETAVNLINPALPGVKIKKSLTYITQWKTLEEIFIHIPGTPNK